MQLKHLLKHNSVELMASERQVVKSPATPFRRLTAAWCRHEAGCLRDLAALGFPGVPRLIRCDKDRIVMELVDGTPLNKYPIIAQPLFLRVFTLVEQMHGFGFAHGNLRPSNVLITAGDQPVLIDFETCCSRPNPLFFLARFNDHVRLHLLWQQTLLPYAEHRDHIAWPGHLLPAMALITPINRLARWLRATKRRRRKSRERRCGLG